MKSLDVRGFIAINILAALGVLLAFMYFEVGAINTDNDINPTLQDVLRQQELKGITDGKLTNVNKALLNA